MAQFLIVRRFLAAVHKVIQKEARGEIRGMLACGVAVPRRVELNPMATTVTEELRLPEPGERILGKYELLRLVGEGGMGAVFEAEHLKIHQRVAIKILLPARSTGRDTTRFSREARAASQLQTNHVARVLDVDSLPNGLPFMVMEFLDGCDLEEELRIRGRLGISEAVDYVIQVCEAVAEAHARGIVHRDLKPSNLFLCSEDAHRLVKVLDFGISKMQDEANVTLTCTALGTPLYMSPEQIRSAKDVDHRSDIWSLGVILFELIAGRPPFEGGATAVSVAIAVDPPPWLRSLRPEVSPELEQVVMTALEKLPSRRFRTVAALAEALQPFASDPTNPGRVRIDALPREVAVPGIYRAFQSATTLDSAQRVPGRGAISWDAEHPSRRRFPLLTVLVAAVAVVGVILVMRGAPWAGSSLQAGAGVVVDSVALPFPATSSASAARLVPSSEPPPARSVAAPTSGVPSNSNGNSPSRGESSKDSHAQTASVQRTPNASSVRPTPHSYRNTPNPTRL